VGGLEIHGEDSAKMGGLGGGVGVLGGGGGGGVGGGGGWGGGGGDGRLSAKGKKKVGVN